MKKPKPIKPFKTLDEEAHFWATHDVSKLVKNPKTSVSKLPPLGSEKKEILTIRLQKSIKDKIEKIAYQKGINVSTLSRMWLIEKLKQSLSF
jgi:hypothetical protein